MRSDLATAPLLSVKQAAAYLSVSESTVRRLVRAGKLEVRRVGAQLRFENAELDRLSVQGTPGEAGATGLPSDDMKVPSWAEGRLGTWREALAEMLPGPLDTQVVVIDRRGAKAFSMLRPGGYEWGANLWHSTALSVQSDEQVLKLFDGKQVVVFDEMVQRGRHLASVRARLQGLGLAVHSICLIRRRSMFLDGQLADLRVEPIQDLADPDFDDAATFLSRLFDYCEPPLDPEHVLIAGDTESSLTPHEAQERLSHFGPSALIWNRQTGQDSAVAALTIDRPRFFDIEALPLPGGISARWDGPCKIRLYLSQTGRLATLTFITFPSLSGDDAAWAALVDQTRRRHAAQAPPASTGEPKADDVERAYVDVCTDLSIELLRQAVGAGLLDRLGMQRVRAPQANELAAFFGGRRGKEMDRQIHGALRESSTPGLALPAAHPVPLMVDRDRRFSVSVDPEAAQKAVVSLLAAEPPTVAGARRTGITYLDLLVAVRPIEESAISAALDGVLDGVRAKPVDVVCRREGGYEVARGFASSEYRDESSYEVVQLRRTQAIAVSAFQQWLAHRGEDQETEIRVAKLFANLVHDWAPQFEPLAIENYPYKHGMLPGLDSKVPWHDEQPRYFVRELSRDALLDVHRAGRADHYGVAPDVDVADLVDRARLSGHERSQVKALVRAYALVQERCKVTRRRTPGQGATGTFSDPLVVLSSARNEQIAYDCALFEIGDWISIGRGLFRLLGAHASRSAGAYAERARRELAIFAQAAAFLFGKLSMYKAVPDLREQLVELFDHEALDAGDIILESVDATARFETDYTITDHPMGLLAGALEIMRPFSSLVRQLLTLFGVEQDRRRPEDRAVVLEDGSTSVKDVRHYARELARAAGDHAIAADAARLAERALIAGSDPRAQQAVLDEAGAVFEQIVALLRARIKTGDALQRDHDRRDERHLDLLEVSRLLDDHDGLTGGGTFVAVGDFYNFVNFVERAATLTGVAGATVGQALQEEMRTSAAELESRFVGTVARVSADTCVVACDDADQLLAAADHLNAAMRLQVEGWDRGLLEVAYMRVGMTGVDRDFFAAVVTGMKLGDRHGFARGAIAISDDAYARLAPHNTERCVRHDHDGERVWVIGGPEEDR